MERVLEARQRVGAVPHRANRVLQGHVHLHRVGKALARMGGALGWHLLGWCGFAGIVHELPVEVSGLCPGLAQATL